MKYCLLVRPLTLILSIFLHFHSSLSSGPINTNPVLTYHNGPLLTGNINLGLMWYGSFGDEQRNAIETFITSLNTNHGDVQPQVATWWQKVESYQAAVPKNSGKSPPVLVKALKQTTDNSYKQGKSLAGGHISKLVADEIKQDPNIVPVIFTAKDVVVQGLCSGRCELQDVYNGKTPYIVVGDLETQCPGTCAWPFHEGDQGPVSMSVEPPSGNVGADAMVLLLATALAEVVTNPLKTGFYQGQAIASVGAVTACRGIFGSGAFPGYLGKVRMDPTTSGAFNAHGDKSRKFLLPALWDPKTSTCWTLV